MPPQMARMISRPLRMVEGSDIWGQFFRPYGAECSADQKPMACAMGYHLSPLRGYSSRIDTTHGLRHGLSSSAPTGLGGRCHLFRPADAAFFIVQGDLVLEDLLDHHFQISEVVAIDERTGAVHQLEHAALDEGGELKAAADFVDDFIGLESFDHG